MTCVRVEASDIAPAEWNDWLRCANGSPYQATSFAAYWREILGYRPRFLTARAGDTVVGGLLAFEYHPLSRMLFSTPGRAILRAISLPFMRCVGGLGGPFVFEGESGRETVVALLRKAHAFQGLAGGACFRSIPLPGALDASTPIEFPELGGAVEEEQTILCMLEKDEECAWKGLPSSGRKAIRHAEKEGLIVEELDGGVLSEAQRFWQLCDTAKGQGSYGDALPRISSEFLVRDGFTVRYFLALHEGRPVSGLGLHVFGGVAREIAAWTVPDARRLHGGDAIKWAVIRWCVRNGVAVYDLAGIAPEPRSSKEEHIARFKKKWSRTIVRRFCWRTRGAFVGP